METAPAPVATKDPLAFLERNQQPRPVPASVLSLVAPVPLVATGTPDILTGTGKAIMPDVLPLIRAQQAKVTRTPRLSQRTSVELRDNKAYVLEAVGKNAAAIIHASYRLRSDKEVAMAACAKSGQALKHVVGKLKWDKDVVLAAVGQNGAALSHASALMRTNDVVFKVAVLNGYMGEFSHPLEHCSKRLRGDREFVLAVVGRRGQALRYAAAELRADAGVALAACRQDPEALKHVSRRLYSDKDFMLEVVSRLQGTALRHASDALRGDKQVVLAAVISDSMAIKHASKDMQEDKEAVIAAVVKDHRALRYAYASRKLLEDRDVVLAAMSEDGWEMYHNDENDQEFMLFSAGLMGSSALYHASAGLRGPEAMVRATVAQNDTLQQHNNRGGSCCYGMQLDGQMSRELGHIDGIADDHERCSARLARVDRLVRFNFYKFNNFFVFK